MSQCSVCGKEFAVSTNAGVDPWTCPECMQHHTQQLPGGPTSHAHTVSPCLEPDNQTEHDIYDECVRTARMLIKKNRSYGNSALNPIRCFSKSDTVEQLKVRIDDKLSRLMRGKEFPGDDTVNDLLGYLVLLKVAEKQNKETNE